MAIAIGVGDILIVSIERPAFSEDPYWTFRIRELSRFFVSDMKIVNIFLFKEEQTSPSSFKFDILAANVRAEIIRKTINIT